jgi:lipopolysaccharide export system ATP-binding protein
VTEGAVADISAPVGHDGTISRLEARHLQKSYGSRKVVKDVSLSVQKGEVVGLLGPNGAGKTTSFYMIVGLVRADAGEITIDGKSVEHMPIHRRSRLGLSYLPQEASIFRKLTVSENVRAVLELQRDDEGQSLSKAEIERRLAALHPAGRAVCRHRPDRRHRDPAHHRLPQVARPWCADYRPQRA